MKIDIKTMFKELGLPAALIVIFSGVLMWLGSSLDQVLKIASILVGVASLISLVVNVLKWVGVVNDGTAGKWQAALNLGILIAISGLLRINPAFDFGKLDAQAAELARVIGVVFFYVTQIITSKSVHASVTHGLGIKPFSYSRQ